MRKIFLLLVVCLFSVILVSAQEITQGSLYAVNKKGVEMGECPLKSTKVTADISGFITRVRVVQEFENNFNEPVEAVYTFPLSQTAAVDDMTMKIGERTIRGRILKREEARKVYETAKEEGKTASLLDQERPNIFTQSIANILPNEKIYIEISYVETLKFEDGSYEFVFPMTVAPRYIPNAVESEDVEKISPPVSATRAGHDISIQINLNAGVPVEEIRSGSHEIRSLNLSAESAKISLRTEKTIPNKDFVLRFDVTGKKMEDGVLTNYGAKGGFFSLILSPPERLSSEDIAPKEIVFVLDTSGSMEGFPIEKAKESMKMALDNLYPTDTFNLITFAGDTNILFDQPVPATRANLDRAQEFLAAREGDGGTEMMKAVKAALAPSDAQDHIRIVCFMTDGQVGNEDEIIAEVKKHPKARVFSFGIGDSVNRFLLDNIAKEGRGEAEYVLLEDDGSRAARRFHERIRNPYLTDISIEWNGLPVTDIYPKRIPDLFGAKPIVIFGRYAKAANGAIKLKGKIGGQFFEREIAVNLRADEKANDVLTTLWARTKIDELMSQNWDFDEEDRKTLKIQNEITKLGLDYRLMTQFTSFVAVEERIVTRTTKSGKKVRVPVYAPAGTVFEEEESGAGGGGGRSAVMYNMPADVQNLSVTVNGQGSGRGTGAGSGTASTFGAGLILPATPTPPAKPVSTGVINGAAVNLPKPAYPSAARAVKADGTVSVQVTIDENGKVISASAVSGHPLLRQAAEQAALNSEFKPTMLSGKAVKVTGLLVYNFVGATNPVISQPPNEAETLGTVEIPIREEITPEMKRRQILAEKLHVWLFDLVERLEKNLPAKEAETKFVRAGKANIQIVLTKKTLETIEKLKTLGFEIVSEKNAKTVLGRIELGKLASLAEIAEAQYILPDVR